MARPVICHIAAQVNTCLLCFTCVSETLVKTLLVPQLQQDKKRLREEAERATLEAGELRQEVELLRGRLEETEWGLCQKTGELSLLKAQLKDSQVRGGVC